MKKRKIPKTSLVLMIMAFVILAAGSAIAAFAQPEIISEDYKSEFELDHIDVELAENGIISSKIKSGELISYMDGKVDPGREYKEEIACRNMTDVDEYVRLVVKAYWLDPDGSKASQLDPDLIQLTFDDKDYNTSDWQINPDETTRERRVFYYNTALAAGKMSEPVVNKLVLSGKVLEDLSYSTEKKGDKTVYTYEYKYDGYRIAVEADVQSLQTHNVNQAIKSVWGVSNVTVQDGRLTVE